MPGGDRTGPMGEGPMTGRGLGYCADSRNFNNRNARPRRFMAYRRGAGSGRGRGMGLNSRRFAGRGRRR